jgi:hypothetical protein
MLYKKIVGKFSLFNIYFMKYLKLFEEYSNKPTLAYHGTSFEFDEFKTRRGASGYGYSMGAYFSSNEEESKRYGKIVKPYHLYFNKLLDLSFIEEDDSTGSEKFFDYMENEYNMFFRNRKSLAYSNPYFGYTRLEHLDREYNLVPNLKKKGVDGIAFNEGKGITYVVFNKNQVRKVNI